MAVSRVDRRYRIVIEKKLREKVKINPGDQVFLEPIDRNTFRLSLITPEAANIEEDPAWRALHAFVKPKRSIPAERLHRFMEEEAWET